MAKVLLTSQVARLTGSIAGTTYQGGRFGTIAKTKRRAAAPPSPLRSHSQAVCSLLVQGWRSLSEAQRKLWLLSDFEGHKGFNLFRWWNYYLARAHMRYAVSPVISVLPAFVITRFAVVMDTLGRYTISVGSATDYIGYEWVVLVTKPSRPGCKVSYRSWYYLIATDANNGVFIFNDFYILNQAHWLLFSKGSFAARLIVMNKTTGEFRQLQELHFQVN